MSFTLTWAGECSAWECDELGHLNMRHYVYKTAQARAGLIIRMGLANAFKLGATSSIRVKDFHIKYQGEARPGDPLKIEQSWKSLSIFIYAVFAPFLGRRALKTRQKNSL